MSGSSRGRGRYSLIGGGGPRNASVAVISRLSIRAAILHLFIIVCTASIGGLVGRYTSPSQYQINVPLDVKRQIFRYNRTFGEGPSSTTDRAWEELFPEQGGFFAHPALAPKRSAFSVFHQLHCLNGIREGYWTVFQAATEGRRVAEQDLPMMSSPPHIRHCIDLLRHSLMCNPDTTVEVKDEEAGGVTGFGTEHQCKDWDQLLAFTRKWQSYGQEGPDELHMNRNESHLHDSHRDHDLSQ